MTGRSADLVRRALARDPALRHFIPINQDISLAERPITVDQGTNTLVGRDRARAAACVDAILRDGGKRGRVPELWDGRASQRIAADLAAWLAVRTQSGVAVAL